MKEKLAFLGGPKTVTIPSPPYPVIGAGEISAAIQVLMSGELSDCGRGEFVACMEDGFRRYFGTRHALSFGSGTAAIHGALFAVGVCPGAEVLTVNYTWISAITAILHAGGTPVFCDIKPGTFHIDPDEIKQKAGPHTRAVVVTHVWGIPADMDPILKVAGDLNLAVVEDCSHAQGARYKGRLAGTIGDIGCFSLQASKAIIAGEGGVIVTDDERLYQRAMIPGHHGVRLAQELTLDDLKPFVGASGYWKYRIPTLAAAIAAVQLERLDELNARRQANFDRLHRRLSESVPFISWPKLHRRSVRGWYGTPAFYDYDPGKVPVRLFAEACQAEGVAMGTEGYGDWRRAPLFQDMSLFSQLWVVKHANGVEYHPLPDDALPDETALRQRFIRFPIPAADAPELMDQMATGVEKVAGNMSLLARHAAKHGAG
jgi:dTDP-4-amino-4,6-dideoxygalactose transaminase